MRRLVLLALLLLCSSPARSNSLVQSNNGGTASGTSATCVLNSATSSLGDLVIVDVNWGGAGVNSDYSVTDGASTSYSAVFGSPITQGNELTMWFGKLTSGQSSLTITVSITGNGSHTIRIGCFDYSGPWQSSPLDVSSPNTSASGVTVGTAGNITPSASGELIHSAIEFGVATNTNSVDSPCTIQPANGTATTGWRSDGRANSGDNQNSGNTSTTCTFRWANASAYGAAIAAFKPAPATRVRHRVTQD